MSGTLSLSDVRFTTRRPARTQGDRLTEAGPAAAPLVYPRLMRDRAALPKVEIAIRYFESLLGRERRECDTEVLVQFFADHKLARCVIAALARSYRFRSPRLDELCSPRALAGLLRAGIDSPVALRLRLYDRTNDALDGFAGGAAQEQLYAELEAELNLKRGTLARLLHLDAPEHAVLRRIGEAPRPEDVVAQLNAGILQCLLRQAEVIEVHLAPGEPAAEGAAAVAAAHEVDLARDGRRLILHGRQDALGSWARHGRRVVRCLAYLLEAVGPSIAGGEARLAIWGRRLRLPLTAEHLAHLSGRAPATGWSGMEHLGARRGALLAAAATVHGELTRSARVARAGKEPPARRQRRGAAGLRLHRQPEAQAWEAGVFIPDVLIQTGEGGLQLCIVRSTPHAERLAAVAPAITTGEPLVCLGDDSTLAPLRRAGAWTVTAPGLAQRSLTEALRSVLRQAVQTEHAA